MRYRFVSAAEEEFTNAAVFYEAEAGLGDEFIAAVLGGINRLLEMPLIGSLVGARVRSIPLDRFPVNIVYKVDDNEIVIVAVAHQSRRPAYWRHRL